MADIKEIDTMSAADCAELAAFAAMRCWHIQDPHGHADNAVLYAAECHSEAKRGLVARARLTAADCIDYALKAWAWQSVCEPFPMDVEEEKHIRDFIATVLSD